MATSDDVDRVRSKGTRGRCVTVGHRALVAYERDDGRYDVHYSHWGGYDLCLAREIGPGTPFGGIADAVDPEPIAVDLTLEDAVGECTDFLAHEAFFVVSTDVDVSTYRVCWFGVHTSNGVVEGDTVVGRGALLSVRADDPRDDGYVTGWWDCLRGLAGEMIDRDELDERDLVPFLVDHLERFGGDHREVIVDPIRDR